MFIFACHIISISTIISQKENNLSNCTLNSMGEQANLGIQSGSEEQRQNKQIQLAGKIP